MNRILSKYNNTNNKSGYLAKKWSSKEAISKAWGTGIRGNTKFKNIEVRYSKLLKQGRNILCKIIVENRK